MLILYNFESFCIPLSKLKEADQIYSLPPSGMLHFSYLIFLVKNVHSFV